MLFACNGNRNRTEDGKRKYGSTISEIVFLHSKATTSIFGATRRRRSLPKTFQCSYSLIPTRGCRSRNFPAHLPNHYRWESSQEIFQPDAGFKCASRSRNFTPDRSTNFAL